MDGWIITTLGNVTRDFGFPEHGAISHKSYGNISTLMNGWGRTIYTVYLGVQAQRGGSILLPDPRILL